MPSAKSSEENPRASEAADSRLGSSIRGERDALLDGFVSKRAALADELGRENERLRAELALLEDENTLLRTQVASDTAIRDLLKSIEDMEKDKRHLLEHMSEARTMNSRFTTRFAELERELEHFVNLYVATHQLHGSLRPATVIRQLREIMMQLVGAESVAIYLADEGAKTLVPVSCQGVPVSDLLALSISQEGVPTDSSRITKAFVSRTLEIMEGDIRGSSTALPAACIPMNIDERVVGVIVIFSLLGHKTHFSPIDFELMKMVSKNAAPALLAAHLFVLHEGKLPNMAALREVLL